MTDDASHNVPETPLQESVRRLEAWRRPKGETPIELAARLLINPPDRRR